MSDMQSPQQPATLVPPGPEVLPLHTLLSGALWWQELEELVRWLPGNLIIGYHVNDGVYAISSPLGDFTGESLAIAVHMTYIAMQTLRARATA